jgi:hypothetical protein
METLEGLLPAKGPVRATFADHPFPLAGPICLSVCRAYLQWSPLGKREDARHRRSSNREVREGGVFLSAVVVVAARCCFSAAVPSMYRYIEYLLLQRQGNCDL